jgi:hypothetical protein
MKGWQVVTGHATIQQENQSGSKDDLDVIRSPTWGVDGSEVLWVCP